MRRRSWTWWAGASRWTFSGETPAAAARAVRGTERRTTAQPGGARQVVDRPGTAAPRGFRPGVGMADAADPRAGSPGPHRIRPGSVGRSPALRGRGSGAGTRNTARASPRQSGAHRARHARGPQARRRPCRAWRRKRRVFDAAYTPATTCCTFASSIELLPRCGRSVPARLHITIDPLQLVEHAVHVVPVAADAVRLAAIRDHFRRHALAPQREVHLL